MRIRVLALTALFVIGSSAACGVPAQDEPHAVELPRNPLAQPTADQAPEAAQGGFGEVVCMVRDGRLIQSVRRVATFPSVQQQLDELVTGPTRAEQNQGLTTALSGLDLAARDRSGSTVTVEVTEPDEGSARSDEVLAYGQIVCTLTARVDVLRVAFTRDGRRLQVPRADGTLAVDPLRASDYADLIGPA
ncbi:GerMN domain-containing protein [Actinoplanes sp. TRM 88003]|uniref:GerMN domain-containing protein n=1 Tax=Paractinoplanes aksuensis TaxID=2939490 RepID=A0ABT1E3J5_9ACTN|nr:GerMN domain-containing protein [Actinoplanes aksuensis]MCO8277673.1 GerMN domain-containing protein [Actinoplanes aksuensis]